MIGPHSLKLALVEPEIPQNAGNVVRLCAATGTALHLVRPLGFVLSDRHFKRAGMDYFSAASITVHDDLKALRAAIKNDPLFLTTGLALQPPAMELWQARFEPDAWLLFGKESAGLPAELLIDHPHRTLRIPMQEGTRGLNLATAAGIVLYEALRQISAK